MYNKVNLELTDFQKVFSSDLIHPFESKLPTDQTYLESELHSFRDNWNNAMTDLSTKGQGLKLVLTWAMLNMGLVKHGNMSVILGNHHCPDVLDINNFLNGTYINHLLRDIIYII